MLLFRSYVLDSDFPCADQSTDEVEFDVNELAPLGATRVIRDRL